MAEEPSQPAHTPPATKAVAQTDETSDLPNDEADFSRRAGEAFDLGASVRRVMRTAPHEREPGEPIYRPLRIYALDPAESKLAGAQATVNVPYEPLAPGPVGKLFTVDDRRDDGTVYPPLNLEEPRLLIQSGLNPSPANPQFHQQMVYAVGSTIYAAFRKALGRQLHWGFGEDDQRRRVRLRIRPHAAEEENAYYNPEDREIRFGYYRARGDGTGRDRNLKGGWIFTCLSHDIVAHEVSHAIVDGLRPHFTHPSNPDALAVHEAIADLVAIFQHFSYQGVVLNALQQSRGQLHKSGVLLELARQFGHTTGGTTSLRTAVRPRVSPDQLPDDIYDPELETHDLGSVLVSAVFEAFDTVYRRKTRDYIRLATGGTGELPPGDIPELLQRFLADEATRIASQFLSICIRSIDYCPPMDVTFGDYLRAMITADFDLVPDDPWAYREALIDAFRARQIFPMDVHSLAEDALVWLPPERPVRRVERLSFGELQFRGDPGRPADARELVEQARALGRIVTEERYRDLFGLARPDDKSLRGDDIEPPRIESVRTSRRVGPDGQILFDLIGEVSQRRWLRAGAAGANTGAGRGRQVIDVLGGSTVIVGPDGTIRYVIRKNVLSDRRIDRQRQFALGAGKHFWQRDGQKLTALKNLFALLHKHMPAQKT